MKEINKKIIALLPIRNEAWILPTTLTYLSSFCDQIIIGDQISNDGSRDIYKDYPKVKVVDNEEKFHSNKIRWKLLDEARKIEGKNILVFLDADEFVDIDFFKKTDFDDFNEGDILEFKWINLWRDKGEYRSDRYWDKLTKTVIFIDDNFSDYNKIEVINDHTARIPGDHRKKILIKEYPIVHIEFLFWEKSQIKQVWYRCSELIKKPESFKKINYKYKDSKESNKVKTKNISSDFLKNIELPDADYEIKKDWRYNEIIKWFNKYGIVYFESLDIWHIKKLEEEFIKRVGRKPKSKNYPRIIMLLNDIKNKIKNEILN